MEMSFAGKSFNEESILRFRKFLKTELWQDFISHICPKDTFNAFSDILLYHFQVCSPMRRSNKNNKQTNNYKLSPELRLLRNKITLFSEDVKMIKSYKNKICNYTLKYRK